MKLVHVSNVFEGGRVEREIPFDSTATLADYLPRVPQDRGLVVQVDGRTVAPERWHKVTPRPDSRIVVADVPAGFVAAAVSFIAAKLGSGFLWSALFAGITFAASTLLRPTPPKQRAGGEPRGIGRGFRGASNTTGAGESIPFGYGEVLVAGHVIESYQAPFFDALTTDEGIVVSDFTTDSRPATLNTRVAIAGHAVESISEIEIDGNPIANISGVHTEVQLGDRDQVGAIGFDESRPAETDFSRDPIRKDDADGFIYRLSGIADRFDIQLVFPSGLFNLVPGSSVAHPRTIQFKLEYRRAGTANWINLLSDQSITNARTTPFSFWIQGPRISRAIYEIRILRLTDDLPPENVDAQDSFQVDSIFRVISGRRTYPNLASFTVRQIPVQDGFSSPPRRYTCVAKLKKVRVYTSESAYTVQWSDNPAWCAADFITDPINGLGEFYSWENVHIPDFLAWAQHCNTQVPDGFGATHRRSTFNYLFDRPIPAMDVLEMMQRAGEAWVYEIGGVWRAKIDKASAPVTILSEGDYDVGSLKFGGNSDAFRPAIVRGNFVNRLKDFAEDSLPVLDEELTSSPTIGRRMPTQVNVLGVDHPERVNRILYRALLGNRYETDVVELEAGIEGLVIDIGDVFGLASSTIGQVATGKIERVRGDRRTLILDQAVNFQVGASYEITLIQQLDPNVVGARPKTVTKTITFQDNGGFGQAVTTSDDVYGWFLRGGDSYSLAEVGSTVDYFRAMSVEVTDTLRVSIRATRYDARVYQIPPVDLTSPDDIEGSPEPTPFETDTIPGPVRNITAFFPLTEYTIAWLAPETGIVREYEIRVRELDNDPITGVNTPSGPWLAPVVRTTATQVKMSADTQDMYSAWWRVAIVPVSQTGKKPEAGDAAFIDLFFPPTS